jgi:glycosyltransferase involved in cell wall biosynthesis
MRVTVIICTKNRAASLEATIQSLSRVDVPRGWEADLLVVDNGSTDHTRVVVEGVYFAGRKARF